MSDTTKRYSTVVNANGVMVCLEVVIPSGEVRIDEISNVIAQAVGKVAFQALPDDITFGAEAFRIAREKTDG